MKFYGYILIFVVFLTSCSNTSYEYKGENGSTNQKMVVPVGAGDADFEYSIVTNYAFPLIESDYPTIMASYGSKSNQVNNIKKLDVKLLVDGKEIAPDIEEYEASYFNTFLKLDKKDCCAMLGERLGIDVSQRDNPSGFGVRITKKYKSLKRLPEEITIVLSAVSDKGLTESEKKLTLSSYKDNNFIRVH